MHKHLLLLLATLISILMNTACQQEESAKQEKEINMDYVPEYINLWPAMQAPDQVYYLDVEGCPEEIGVFKNLRVFNIQRCKVDSSFNASFRQIENLKKCTFYETEFEELIFTEKQRNSITLFRSWGNNVIDEEAFFKSLYEIESLEVLTIGKSNVRFIPDYFKDHPNLSQVLVGGDTNTFDFEKTIENISLCKKVYSFEINDSDIRNLPSNISLLNHLSHIGFFKCPNIDPKNTIMIVKDWKNLESISFQFMNLSMIPEEIEQLNHLKKIGLYNIENLNIFQALEVLSKLEQLEELDISSCMSNVPSDSTTGMLDDLPKLQNLKKLDMSYNLYFKPEYYWGIISQLSQLEELRMIRGGNRLTPDVLNLKNLKKLDISDGGSKGLVDITQLPALEVFNYDGSMVKEFPEVLLKTTSLVSLSLFNNEIKEIPTEISNLVNLEHLDISNNPINDLPESIKELKEKLQYLDILSTPLAQNPAKVAQLKEWLPNTMIFIGK